MPINPTSAADWRKAIKLVSVTALAVMSMGAIVFPLLGIVAGMSFAG